MWPVSQLTKLPTEPVLVCVIRMKTRKRSREEEKPALSVESGSSDGWNCPFCTLLNAPRRRRCAACQARRPVLSLDEKDDTLSLSQQKKTNRHTSSDRNNNDSKNSQVKRKRKAPKVAAWLRSRRQRSDDSSPASQENKPNEEGQSTTMVSLSLQVRLAQQQKERDGDSPASSVTAQPWQPLTALVPQAFARHLLRDEADKEEEGTSFSPSSNDKLHVVCCNRVTEPPKQCRPQQNPEVDHQTDTRQPPAEGTNGRETHHTATGSSNVPNQAEESTPWRQRSAVQVGHTSPESVCSMPPDGTKVERISLDCLPRNDTLLNEVKNKDLRYSQNQHPNAQYGCPPVDTALPSSQVASPEQHQSEKGLESIQNQPSDSVITNGESSVTLDLVQPLLSPTTLANEKIKDQYDASLAVSRLSSVPDGNSSGTIMPSEHCKNFDQLGNEVELRESAVESVPTSETRHESVVDQLSRLPEQSLAESALEQNTKCSNNSANDMANDHFFTENIIEKSDSVTLPRFEAITTGTGDRCMPHGDEIGWDISSAAKDVRKESQDVSPNAPPVDTKKLDSYKDAGEHLCGAKVGFVFAAGDNYDDDDVLSRRRKGANSTGRGFGTNSPDSSNDRCNGKQQDLELLDYGLGPTSKSSLSAVQLGECDTPTSKEWEPITQNDRTRHLAARYDYTPLQSQDHSCSFESCTSQSEEARSPDLSPLIDGKPLALPPAIAAEPSAMHNATILNECHKFNGCSASSRCENDSCPDGEGVAGDSMSEPDHENERESAVPRHHKKQSFRGRSTLNQPFSGFQTAGENKMIAIDAGALAKARALLSEPRPSSRMPAGTGNRDMVQTSSASTSKVSFQTAGRQKPLKVTEADLHRARGLLVGTSADSSGTEKVVRGSLTSDYVKARSTKLPFFQTTGINRTLRPGKEEIEHAKCLLGPNKPRAFVPSGRQLGLSEKTKSSRVSFQTAGKQRALEIHDADMESARILLNDSFRTSAAYQSGRASHQTQIKRYTEKEDYSIHTQKMPQSKGVFRHNVSAASANHSSLINISTSDHARVTETPGVIDGGNPPRVSFAKAGSDSTIQPQHHGISINPSSKSANISLDSVSTSPQLSSMSTARPCASFETAGTSSAISISESAMLLARELLSADSKNQSSVGTTPESEFKTPSLSARKTQHAAVSFHTAGKGDAVEVCQESLERARNLLPFSSVPGVGNKSFSSALQTTTSFDTQSTTRTYLFSTAGKGRGIKVSEASLQKAKDLFAVDSLRHSRSDAADPSTGQDLREHFTHASSESTHLSSGGGLVSETASSLMLRNNSHFKNTRDTSFDFETPAARARGIRPARVSFTVPRASAIAGNANIGGIVRVDDNMVTAEKSTAGRAPDSFQTPISGHDSHRPTRLSFGVTLHRVATDESRKWNSAEAFAQNNVHGPTTGVNSGISSLSKRSCAESDEKGFKINQAERTVAAVLQKCGGGENESLNLDPEHVQIPDDDGEARDQQHAAMFRESLNKIDMTTNADQCLAMGVLGTTLAVNGSNGAMVVFDTAGRPTKIQDGNEGTEKWIRAGLIARSCDCTKISSKWIRNHCRWVCWKLASMERRFPHILGTSYFTSQRLLQQLYSRFQKEFVGGMRSPLRKVLNRDVAPSTMMILCIAKIDTETISADGSSKPKKSFNLELTDGWYSVHAKPDLFLCRQIHEGRIRTGTKLLVSNASLYGSADGVDPLDEGYESSPETSLKIFANSTRIAKWDAKLGFLKFNRQLKEAEGLLHVQKLRDIIRGGGRVPLIDFIVVKRHPLLFLKQCSDQTSKVLTEAEEDARIHRLEDAKTQLAEDVSNTLEEECSKVSTPHQTYLRKHCNVCGPDSFKLLFSVSQEVDAMAPQEWHEMSRHACPSEFLAEAPDSARKSIYAWQLRRKELITERIRQELEACFEDKDLDLMPSKPFLKVLIRDSTDATTESCQREALLTIWGPTSSQLELLQEGVALRAKQLSVRDVEFNGLLQLSANARTVFQSVPRSSATPVVAKSAPPKKPLGVFQACLLSKKYNLSQNAIPPIDLVGTLIKLETANCKSIYHTYLTDRSGMIIRVQSRKPLKAVNRKSLAPILLRSIKISPFDHIENVGVAWFDACSLVVQGDVSASLQRLRKWLETKEGQKVTKHSLNLIDSRLPPKPRMRVSFISLLCHLVEFRVLENTQLVLSVDCGDERLLHLNLPLSLLGSVGVESLDHVVLSPDEESRMAKLTRLGQVFCSRSLLQIVARELEEPLPGWELCTHQVVDLRVPNLKRVTVWYASALQQGTENQE